jgi:crotonobetainyl-CoA:carnitine CoA-transferase CaiB-like acyl-CoA transferase
MLSSQALNYLASGRDGRRLGNAHPSIVPYDVFPVADGHVIIATGNDGQFRKLCEILGAPDLAAHPDYLANRGRVAHREALTAALHALTAAWPRDALLASLAAAHVPAGPINTVAQVFADPQVTARGMALTLDNPEAGAGTTPGVRSPILIDGVAQASTRPAPGLGQHEAEVLADPAWGGEGGTGRGDRA